MSRWCCGVAQEMHIDMLWSRTRSTQAVHKKCVSRHNALVARLHNMCTSKMHTPDSAHVMHWCTALHVQCFSAHIMHMQSPYVLQDALLKTVHMWCTVVVSASWMCTSTCPVHIQDALLLKTVHQDRMSFRGCAHAAVYRGCAHPRCSMYEAWVVHHWCAHALACRRVRMSWCCQDMHVLMLWSRARRVFLQTSNLNTPQDKMT